MTQPTRSRAPKSADQALAEFVRATVAKAPPLTPEQRHTIATLLTPTRTAA